MAAGGYAGAVGRAAECRGLQDAVPRQEQGDNALANAQGRGHALQALGEGRPADAGSRRHRLRAGNDHSRGYARAGGCRRVPLRRGAPQKGDRARRVQDHTAEGAGHGRDNPRRRVAPRRYRARRPLRRPHRVLQRRRALSGISPQGNNAQARRHVPDHDNRPPAQGGRCHRHGIEQHISAFSAAPVPGGRRLLPADGGGLVQDSGRLHQEGVPWTRPPPDDGHLGRIKAVHVCKVCHHS